MAESPASSLSSILSEDIPDDVKLDEHSASAMTPTMPPSKRRRIGTSHWDRQTPLSSMPDEMPGSPVSSISSDTSGDIPNSPTVAGPFVVLEDDYGPGNEQVTVCKWDGCNAGDMGNMDDLVRHIHDDHIVSRQKKYSCEWNDCTRKGMSHASGYALRAHMRSHTREKPFYCALPECDRSFTRSDALAKHMRTVHETEALRPSDPVPKHHNLPSLSQPTKPPRIKLKMPGLPSSSSATPGHDHEHALAGSDAATMDLDMDADSSFPLPEFPSEMGFDEHELSLSPSQLYRLLRRQIHWAEQEGAGLKKEVEEIELKKRDAYREKQLAFDDVMDAELKKMVRSTTTVTVTALDSTSSSRTQQVMAMATATATATVFRPDTDGFGDGDGDGGDICGQEAGREDENNNAMDTSADGPASASNSTRRRSIEWGGIMGQQAV